MKAYIVMTENKYVEQQQIHSIYLKEEDADNKAEYLNQNSDHADRFWVEEEEIHE